MTRRRAWLILLASLLDDAALIALVFLALRLFHAKITWGIILAMALGVAGFFFIMHQAVLPVLRRPRATGAEGMIGAEGTVINDLVPRGIIKVKDEYWHARSFNGILRSGATVIVVDIKGLVLGVKEKRP